MAYSVLIAALLCVVAVQAQLPRIHVDKPGPLTLTPGVEHKVTFTLSEPIICKDQADRCDVVVMLTNPDPRVIWMDTCFVKWVEGEDGVSYTVTIKMTETWADQEERVETIVTEAAVSNAFFYAGFNPVDIVVKTRPKRSGQCRGTGDPHYTTFDGKYWHEYAPGQMVFYATRDRTRHDFEMQARVYSRPALHCAIIGRENNAAVLIDICDQRRGLVVEPRFGCPTCSNNPRIEFRSPNQYTVTFPSGTWMRADVHGTRYMNIYVGAPGLDYDNTIGMCGNNNDDPGDDARLYQVHQIRDLYPDQQITEDLFSWQPDPSYVDPTKTPPHAEECNYQPPPVFRPILTHPDGEDITQKLKDAAEGDDAPKTYNFTLRHNTQVTTQQPVDRAVAAQVCANIKETDTAVKCAGLGVDVNKFVEDCVEDLAEMGNDPIFVEDAIFALEAECAAFVTANAGWVPGDNGFEQVLDEDTVAALCPKVCVGMDCKTCNNHGTCNSQGDCDCETGWLGEDCRFDSTTPPVITKINVPKCDTAGKCPVEIAIDGSNFYRYKADGDSKLVCRFGDVQVQALYMGLQMLCEVPKHTFSGAHETFTVDVTVSNDGVLFSNPLKFTWFNSRCDVCDDNGECEPNPESCTIDGKCYLHGMAHPKAAERPLTMPEAQCMECAPRSATEWSFVYHNSHLCGPVFTRSRYSAQIQGQASAGTVLAVSAPINAANELVKDDTENKVTYSLSPATGHVFAIDPTTGQVSVTQDVVVADTDLNTFVNMVKIVATDGAGNVDEADLVVDMLEAGQATLFSQQDYEEEVSENLVGGTTVVQFTSASGSNAGITFEVLQDDSKAPGTFVVDAAGALKLAEGKFLDFEKQTHYFLQVRAQKDGLNHILAVQVIVKDENDVPTEVVLTYPASSTAPGVAENSPVDATIATLTAKDQDVNEVHTFKLEDGTDARVGLSTDGTKLVVKGAINFEQLPAGAKHLVAVITVTDKNGAKLEKQVKNIPVIDVNEAPSDVQVATTSIPEDLKLESVISSVTVSDPDTNQVVRCGIRDSLGGRFVISDNKLILSGKIDFETASSHDLDIVCVDNGVPALSAERKVTITITDANDAPENVKLLDAAELLESSPAGTLVGKVEAVDMDADAGALKFEVYDLENQGASPVRVVPNSVPQCNSVAPIKCTVPVETARDNALDFESRNPQQFGIKVTDNHNKETKLTLSFAVADVNEPPLKPRWLNNFNELKENAEPGDDVGTIIAQDNDRNQRHKFTLVAGADKFVLKKVETRRQRRAGGDASSSTAEPTTYLVKVADNAKFDYETSQTESFTIEVEEVFPDGSAEQPIPTQFTMTVAIADTPMEITLKGNTANPLAGTNGVKNGGFVSIAEGSGRRKVATIDLANKDRDDLTIVHTIKGSDRVEVDANGNVFIKGPVNFGDNIVFKVNTTFTKKAGSNGPAAPDSIESSFTVKVQDLVSVVNPPNALKSLTFPFDSTLSTHVATLDISNPSLYTWTINDPLDLVAFTLFNGNEARLVFKQSPTENDEVQRRLVRDSKYDHQVTVTYVRKDGSEPAHTETVAFSVAATCNGCGGQACVPCPGDDAKPYVCSADGSCTSASSSSSSNTGVIAGVAVGVIVLVAAVAAFIYNHHQHSHPKPLFPEDGTIMSAFNPTYAVNDMPGMGGAKPTYAEASARPTPFTPGAANPLYPWYQPDMTRQDCNDFLMQCADGAFVVRDSKATPGWHMLGVKVGGRVMHEKVKMNDDGTYELLPASNQRQPRFNSLPDLIEHYTEPRSGVSFRLFLATSLDNPMYAGGLGGEDGIPGYAAWGRDADAPNVPLKEREKATVATVADFGEDIYTNTTEAQEALRAVRAQQASDA